jgi:hypothetical protein
MNTMVDEIYDRMYQEGRADLHAGVDRFFGAIGREVGKSLKALHEFEWSAPWAGKSAASSKDVGCA